MIKNNNLEQVSWFEFVTRMCPKGGKTGVFEGKS